MWSSQKFVPSAYIVHSQSCTPSCLSSILLLWQLEYMQLNINGDAATWMVVRWMPQSLVSMHFLVGVELTEICSKCIRRTQQELHTFLPLQYTSSMAARVYAIEYQWRCCYMDGRTMNASKLHINTFPGWCGAHRNLFQVRTSYTARAAHLLASLVY